VVLAIDELHRALAERRDPRLGPGTLSVGLIGGGSAPNIVADEAWAVSDRRTLPGEDAQSVERELLAAAERAGAAGRVRVVDCSVDKEPLATAPEHASVAHCARALERAGMAGTPAAVAFGTDAGPLSHAGIPSVVMGPGSITQAHTAAEFVPLSEVEAMRAFFVELLGS
jgi:acetylornithine deacetylase